MIKVNIFAAVVFKLNVIDKFYKIEQDKYSENKNNNKLKLKSIKIKINSYQSCDNLLNLNLTRLIQILISKELTIGKTKYF